MKNAQSNYRDLFTARFELEVPGQVITSMLRDFSRRRWQKWRTKCLISNPWILTFPPYRTFSPKAMNRTWLMVDVLYPLEGLLVARHRQQKLGTVAKLQPKHMGLLRVVCGLLAFRAIDCKWVLQVFSFWEAWNCRQQQDGSMLKAATVGHAELQCSQEVSFEKKRLRCRKIRGLVEFRAAVNLNSIK